MFYSEETSKEQKISNCNYTIYHVMLQEVEVARPIIDNKQE